MLGGRRMMLAARHMCWNEHVERYRSLETGSRPEKYWPVMDACVLPVYIRHHISDAKSSQPINLGLIEKRRFIFLSSNVQFWDSYTVGCCCRITVCHVWGKRGRRRSNRVCNCSLVQKYTRTPTVAQWVQRSVPISLENATFPYTSVSLLLLLVYCASHWRPLLTWRTLFLIVQEPL